MPRFRFAAVVAACVLTIGGAGWILVVAGDEPQAPERPPERRVVAAPLAAPPPVPVRDALLMKLPDLPEHAPAAPGLHNGLPLPAKVPVNERAPGPIVAIGEIEIPSIAIRHTIYEGVTLTVVDHGPGHWPGSALPGKPGNSVFAGHRTVNDRPFHDLDLVKPGDTVVFRIDGREVTYEVTKTFVVGAEATDIALPTPEPTVTLFACHPKGSAKQRIVVQGRLVSETPL